MGEPAGVGLLAGSKGSHTVWMFFSDVSEAGGGGPIVIVAVVATPNFPRRRSLCGHFEAAASGRGRERTARIPETAAEILPEMMEQERQKRAGKGQVVVEGRVDE
jgi:hypothetical protein